METERTLVLIKPHTLRSHGISAVAFIQGVYLTAGLQIEAVKEFHITGKNVKQLYEEHVGKEFFEAELKPEMISGTSLAMVIAGRNAIAVVRQLNGATDPTKAAPGTIRFIYGLRQTGPFNAVHASSSLEDADRELRIVFPELFPKES